MNLNLVKFTPFALIFDAPSFTVFTGISMVLLWRIILQLEKNND